MTKVGILSQPEQSPTCFYEHFYTYLVERGGGNSHLIPLHLPPGKTLMYRGSIQQQTGIQSGTLWQPAYQGKPSCWRPPLTHCTKHYTLSAVKHNSQFVTTSSTLKGQKVQKAEHALLPIQIPEKADTCSFSKNSQWMSQPTSDES